jgi:hypothetical protein
LSKKGQALGVAGAIEGELRTFGGGVMMRVSLEFARGDDV